MLSSNNQFISNRYLLSLLCKATSEECLQLTRILKDDRDRAPYIYNTPLSPDELLNEISIAGGNSFANVYRGQGNSYLDILDDVAKHILKKEKFPRYEIFERHDSAQFYEFNIDDCAMSIYFQRHNIVLPKGHEHIQNNFEIRNNLRQTPEKYAPYLAQARRAHEIFLNRNAQAIEERIIYKLLDLTYNKMTEHEKNNFDQTVQRIALEKGLTNKKLAKGVAGLIVLGEMGGFTTYMLMSIFLSKIGLGIFGFGVFTGASTLLGIILGPVGWATSATWLLWGFASPNKTKMAKLVATIALIRLRVFDEEQKEIKRRKAIAKQHRQHKETQENDSYQKQNLFETIAKIVAEHPILKQPMQDKRKGKYWNQMVKREQAYTVLNTQPHAHSKRKK